jgi:hypothetical protein
MPCTEAASIISTVCRFSEEGTMDEAEIERIAASVVKKMQEPPFLQELAKAITTQLDLLGVKYRAQIAKLGERLDSTYY